MGDPHARHVLRRWWCWQSWLLAAVLAASLGVRAASAQSLAQASEYQVKAAFICKFASYVEWPPPERAEQPFAIGVLGGSDVEQELQRAAAGSNVGGRPIVVRRLQRGDPVAGLQILFIARTHEARSAEVLAGARGLPMLTVTESEHAMPPGSIVNFVILDDKVRFDIALPPAEAGQLKISARLLGVARKVWTKAA